MIKQSTYYIISLFFFLSLSAQDKTNRLKTPEDSIKSFTETPISNTDSLALPLDSLSIANDSIDTLQNTQVLNVPFAKDGLEEVVTYNAEDSILYDIINEKIYLYGNAQVQQGKITLTAHQIIFNYTEQTVEATGQQDSLGNWIGKPLFEEGEEKFEADELTYNFKTKKGKIADLITQEGDGFLRSEKVKKNEYDELFGYNTYYTTCNLEHPHFRIESKKVKIVPDELIVTGPAKFFVDDVPTPLIIPFGIFPLTEERRSGILLPTYGQSPGQGFYLRNGGFYLGINEHMDLAIRGDLYSRGTWRINLASQYRQRYRYNGTFSLNFGRRKTGDPITDAFSSSNDFRIGWTHSQAAQARPNSSFSASVNLGSTSYSRNFVTTTNDFLSNTLTSSINYSKRFAGTPFNMNLSANHSQSNQTKQIRLTIPEVTLNMTKIQPLKRKKKKGKTQWHEKISVGYTGNFRNTLEIADSLITNLDTLFNNMENGIKHNIPINLPNFNVLKYITISPSITYNEYWYFETIEKSWDSTTSYDTTFTTVYDTIYTDIDTIIQEIPTIGSVDTTFGNLLSQPIKGFKTARDFRASLSMSTRIYGVKQGLKLGPIKAFRHVMNPNISLTWRPDFGSDFWGYYREVQENQEGDVLKYSIFEEGIFRGPASNQSALLTFGIDNNLEIKTGSKKDTTNTLKKVKLLESLKIGSNYDLVKDSLNFGTISMSARTTILNKLNFNFRSTYSPYTVNENGREIDTYNWAAERKLARLKTMNLGVNTSFSSKKKSNNNSDRGSEQEREDVLDNLSDFIDFKIPWRMNIGYNFNLSRTYASVDSFTNNITQTLNISLDLNVTPKWKADIRTGYDFTNKALAYTTVNIYRDLHCWNMSFNWVPTGANQRYEFVLRANSSLLQDLKLQRKRDPFDF